MLDQTVEVYIQALKQHDWFYDFSDDGGVYRAGSQERTALLKLQKDFDPRYEIWNQHCPVQFKR